MNVLAILLSALILSAAAEAETMSANKKPASSNPKFLALCDQFVKDSLALSPVSASQAGYHKHAREAGKILELDAELDDVSAAAFEHQRKFYQEWRSRFEKETPLASLNAEDAGDYRLIDDQISLGLLELEKIQNYKHNPTVFVELLGNGLFLPLTQEYAPKQVRVGHVISRIAQVPRFLDQAKSQLADSDPVFISTAMDENEGNVGQVDSVALEIPPGSALKAKYDQVAPAAKKALVDFNDWMKNDLAKRPTNGRTWRLGPEWYPVKFRYVMETSVDPAQLLQDAEAELARNRAAMLQ